jgi:hypothetical protein
MVLFLLVLVAAFFICIAPEYVIRHFNKSIKDQYRTEKAEKKNK